MPLSVKIQNLLLTVPPFLFALTCHEYAHGFVAKLFGDPTAERAGRLTFNPIKHLDPWGVLFFFIAHIGWAKPVPVDPRYFRDPAKQMIWVSLAGPASNFALAVASGIGVKVLAFLSPVLPAFVVTPLLLMGVASVWINLMLAFFNLVPIPPLDGSRILTGLLPPELARLVAKIEPFGFLLFFGLIYSGILPRVITPMIQFAEGLLIG